MTIYSNLVSQLKSSKFFRYGLPFLVFTVGGSFVLKEFASMRYEVSTHTKSYGLTKEMMRTEGIVVKDKPTTLEEVYDETMKKVDLDSWKNVRGPRPWENDNKEYMSVIEERIAEANRKKEKKGLLKGVLGGISGSD